MKKLFMSMLAVLACGSAVALPLGNPSDASLLCDGLCREGHCSDFCDPCVSWCDAWSIRFGFYGDYVFNRHMQVDHDHNDAVIEDTEIFTNALYLAGNMYDRLDLFVTLGATNLFISTNESAFAAGNGGIFELDTVTDFSWSVGLRATLWECGCTTLGGEFQYFSAGLPVRRVTDDADESTYNERVLSADYSEWQIGFGLSHRINMLVPYIGVMWSGSKLNMDNAVIRDGETIEKILYNLENQKTWAWAVGVSLVDCEKASITAEARFSGEKAVHVNGQIRF